jgi:trehalose utilization protein
MHVVIAKFLSAAGYEVGTATLDEPEHGLTDAVLANTDVLIWWGHMRTTRSRMRSWTRCSSASSMGWG